MALSEIVNELEEQARQSGGAVYRQLQRGLWVRMTPGAEEHTMVCALARVMPSAPSKEECDTVARALAPVFVDRWVERTNVLGPQDKRYNVRSATYTRIF